MPFEASNKSGKVKEIDMLEKIKQSIKREQNVLNTILDNYVDEIQGIYINEYKNLCVKFYSE